MIHVKTFYTVQLSAPLNDVIKSLLSPRLFSNVYKCNWSLWSNKAFEPSPDSLQQKLELVYKTLNKSCFPLERSLIFFFWQYNGKIYKITLGRHPVYLGQERKFSLQFMLIIILFKEYCIKSDFIFNGFSNKYNAEKRDGNQQSSCPLQ